MATAAAADALPAVPSSDEALASDDEHAESRINAESNSTQAQIHLELVKQITAQTEMMEMMRTVMVKQIDAMAQMQQESANRQETHDMRVQEMLEKNRNKGEGEKELPRLITNKEAALDEPFRGDRSKWGEFASKLKTVLGGIHQTYMEALEWAEKQDEEQLTMAKIREENIGYAEAATQLYTKLSMYLGGEPYTMLTNAKEANGLQNGLLAWKRLVRYYDPNNATTRRSLLGQILNPGQAKGYDALNGHLEQWIDKKQKYERMSQKTIEEEYLIGIIIEACPNTLKEHLETNAERLCTFKEVYEEIIRHVERHVSKRTGGKDGKVGSFDMGGSNGEGDEEDGQYPYLSNLGKGKGKGKGGLVCYNCGGHGHPARLCPSRMPIQPGAVVCHGCGGKGHFADQCASGNGPKGGKGGAPKGQWQGGKGGMPKGQWSGGKAGAPKGQWSGGKGGASKGQWGKGFKGGQVGSLGESQGRDEPWMTGGQSSFGQGEEQGWGQQHWGGWNYLKSVNSVEHGGAPEPASDGWGAGMLRMSSLRKVNPIRTGNKFGFLTRDELEEEQMVGEINGGWNPFIDVKVDKGRVSQKQRKKRRTNNPENEEIEKLTRYILGGREDNMSSTGVGTTTVKCEYRREPRLQAGGYDYNREDQGQGGDEKLVPAPAANGGKSNTAITRNRNSRTSKFCIDFGAGCPDVGCLCGNGEGQAAVKTRASLDPLTKIIGSNTVSQLNSSTPGNGWTEMEVTIDSGACETVMPEELCSHIKITPSLQSLRGDEYEVANGETVPNLGERRCVAMTSGSQVPKQITFQCADIHKPLLSTACAADAGYETRLQQQGGYLEHVETKDRIPVYRRENLYYLTMWVRAQPDGGEAAGEGASGFTRQGR